MKRGFGFVGLIVALLGVALGIVVFVFQRSLAPASEAVTIAPGHWPAGAGTRVRIELDGLGVPTIQGAGEAAVAFGQGYAHARDRRFQMELLRRTAAGRLAELVGRPAVRSDRFFRTLGFTGVADSGIRLLGARRRALFEAYAAGVNAYDRGHPAAPEFLLLGVKPEPWRPRDTALVALLMQQDQGWESADEERARELMEATLPAALVAFLRPVTTRWDAPLAAGAMPAPARLPTPEECDVRTARHSARGSTRPLIAERDIPGSNSWAVAGFRSRSGRPLLANDPHMTLRVPTTWHRQRLMDGVVTVTGVTLPGVPGVACGTNGAVAWSMTNPNVDVVDLVRCVPTGADSATYHGPDGPEPFGWRREVIAIKGAAAETLAVRTTRFGPIVAVSTAPGGGLLAAQWGALDPRTVDTDLVVMNHATTLGGFLAALDSYRGPQMSFVVADSAGRIGWKVGGLLPRRAGARLESPRPATDPAAAWIGYLAGAEAPTVIDPASGLLFTANQRTVGGEAWERAGGRVAAPWRARRIAAVLAAAEAGSLDVPAMAALQNDLDDSYLEPTARAIERALAAGEAAAGRRPGAPSAAADTLARVAAIIAAWDRRADSTSVAHAYLVQARAALSAALLEPLLAPCRAVDSTFRYDDALVDEVVARLLEERPGHLLDPRYADYDALVRQAARRAAARLGARGPGGPFDEVSWGAINRGDVAHPLGSISSLVARLLDMPRAAFAGGANVVRVMQPRHGASMRMVVDLADPSRSRFALPGGQSGHFRSPHYGDGYAGWWRGETVPLLPGPAVSTIVLTAASTARR